MAILPIDPLEILSDIQLASRLRGVSVETLRKWRKAGKGPAYLKAGTRAVRYRAVDVEAWMLSQRVIPGEPKGEKSAPTRVAPQPVQDIRLMPPHLRGQRGFR